MAYRGELLGRFDPAGALYGKMGIIRLSLPGGGCGDEYLGKYRHVPAPGCIFADFMGEVAKGMESNIRWTCDDPVYRNLSVIYTAGKMRCG